ncbi:amino acid transporter [Gigaspora margarita]|uniref:Amino acid transporter n=1 Tax=Gigaspora margarita TaxID=4874 RepID=A0A8H3XCL4_GIGMA|nr:amino acid transporter [Gigaspora margarita]
MEHNRIVPNDTPGIDIPEQNEMTSRVKILNTASGLGFNINNIIGAAIFMAPSSVWRLVQSPGATLIFWLVGGTRFPSGSGEQKYLEETFIKWPKFGHIFTFVMVIIILPGGIIADVHVSATYFLYTIQGNDGNQNEYFGKDFIELRFLAVAILFIVTFYHMCSNQLAIKINQIFAIFKFFALLIISIIGLITLREARFKDHWKGIFNNTLSNDTYQRSALEQIGSYGNAMLKVIFSYNGWNNLNYSTEELNSPERRMKYLLMIAAFITVVDPNDAINSKEIIAIHFGRTLFGEPGKRFISFLISVSAFGSVGAMVFMGSRIITYSAQTKFIPKVSSKLYKWNKKVDTPSNALAAQFIYCTILILIFPDGKSLFTFFSNMSSYITLVFYGVSAICLFVLRKKQKEADYRNFKAPLIAVVISFLCIVCLIIAPFFPLSYSLYDSTIYPHYLPFVISWIATLIGVVIWFFRAHN